MDYKEDEFIRDVFKKDDLISKNADDIFNKFIKGDINIEENEAPADENVIDINDAKDKVKKKKENKSKNKGPKRFLSAVASVAVVFVAANVYASTQGYQNIFFMIKDLIKEDVVIEDKEEILSDRDITISYETINIVDGIDIQINRLVIEEDKATLYVVFDELNASNSLERPYSYKVYDVTNGRVDLLSENKTSVVLNNDIKNAPGSIYQEEMLLKKFKEDTSVLMLDVFNKDEEKLISLKIDIENKQIDIVNRKESTFEKISEVELKEVLSTYVALNYLDDEGYDYWEGTKEQAFNRLLVESAIHLAYEKEFAENNQVKYGSLGKLEIVNKVLKEMTGKEYNEPLDLYQNDFYYYNKEEKQYECDNGDSFMVPSMCLDIKDITYKNGVYNVTCIYCHPGSLFDYSELVNMAQYETTFKLEINDDYEYAKYKILNINELDSKLVKESEKVTGDDLENDIKEPENNNNYDNNKNETTNTVVPDKNTTNNENSNNNSNTVSNEKAYVNGRVYEKELVEFLEDIVRINFFNDKNAVTEHYTADEYEDEMKLLAALEISGKDIVSFEEAKNILTELMNEDGAYPNYSHIVVKTENNGYGYISKNYLSSAKLHKIISIKEENGISTATVVYKQRAIDEDLFIVNVRYVENKIYSYSKYKCLNTDSLDSIPYITNDDNLDNDTFAEGVIWNTHATSNINVPIPEHFIKTNGDTNYDGNEAFGTFSFGGEGVIHGYNIDGANAQDSEMKISVYLEEYAENNTLMDYVKRVALRYNILFDQNDNLNKTYYIDGSNNKWFELKGEETKEHMKNYYCMIYKKNDGKTYGRVIELDITNSSERTQNYIDYIMGNIYTFGY